MAQQILDNLQLQQNLDWFQFETAIRKDIHQLLKPFQATMQEYNNMAMIKY